MKVAVIENRLKDYVIDIFNRHQDAQIDLISFLDWKPQQDQYQEISIDRIEELDNGQYDIVLIAIKENRYLSRLLTYLHKKHIQNVYIVRLFALDMREDFLDETQPMYLDRAKVDSIPKENEKPYLVHLETHVCDHCNLNCKACNNFSPFVKEPSYADIDQFERDLKRLTELFTGIGRFFLLGGEPLLAPELCCEMIRCYRKYFPTNELRVLTNATLILSMKDEFWDCVRENDVIIHISLYPPVKERIDEIRERLESEKVRYIVFKEVETFAKHWTAYPFEDEKFNNERCGSAGCHYLRNGEISKCPDAMLVDFMVDGNAELKSLGLNDRENIVQVNNAWELIEKIDNPIDLCKKCTYKRLKPIKWERVDGEAQSSDWLLPHWYENEVKSLICDNKKANDEIEVLNNKVKRLTCDNKKVNDEIEVLNNKVKRLTCDNKKANDETEILSNKVKRLTCDNKKANDEIERLYSEIKVNKEGVIAHEKKEEELKREIFTWINQCDNAHSSLKKVREEYERVNNSYSYRIGRAITWFPRKMRKVARYIRERIKENILIQKYNSTLFYAIWRHFTVNILEGYSIYKQILVKYGISARIYHTAGGAGDIYFCGLFFRNYLMKRHEHEIPVFTVTRESGRKVAQLFSIENIELVPYSKRKNMVNMVIFLGSQNARYEIIHHNPISVHTSISRFMETIHGMCTADILKETVYNSLTPSTEPVFEEDIHYIDSIFEQYSLKRKKTVLLAPYSNSISAIPLLFWEKIAQKLINAGFSVLTNSQGAKEKAIKGTYSITIPIKNMVPFLNEAGYLVGIRSGLFDFTERADIKRVIFYYKLKEQGRGAGGWNNNSYLHFSFNHWYERIDAFEVDYFSDSEQTLIDKMLEFIKGELENGYVNN